MRYSKIIIITLVASIFFSNCTKNIEPNIYNAHDLYNCIAKNQCSKFSSYKGLTYNNQIHPLRNYDYISAQLNYIVMSSPIFIKNNIKKSIKNTDTIADLEKILAKLNIEILHIAYEKGYIYAKTPTKIYREKYKWKWKETNMITLQIENNLNNRTLKIYASIISMKKKPLDALLYDSQENENSKNLKKVLKKELQIYFKDN